MQDIRKSRKSEKVGNQKKQGIGKSKKSEKVENFNIFFKVENKKKQEIRKSRGKKVENQKSWKSEKEI